ncbi:hypothetical protein C8R43DRAFT_594141 [Mycena crocata]|nr:hypothetical protein C8R43DRAFT_594141 [Mycena crocata]
MYRKINPKLGRPCASTEKAERPEPANDDEEDEDEVEEDDNEYSDSEQVGTKRKRRGGTSSPRPVTRSQCRFVTRKIGRCKIVPPARNADSVLIPVRWSLRSRNRDPSIPSQAMQPGKALYDTPVPSEDEDVDGDVEVMTGTAGRPSARIGSRLSTTTAVNIGAKSDIEDANSNDGEECAFRLAAPPSLRHLIRQSPSPSFALSVDGSPFSSRSSLSPPPSSQRSTPRASTPPPGVPHCGNCRSTTSSSDWLRSALEPAWRLCNACYKYERRKHRHRPMTLIQRPTRFTAGRFPSSTSPQCSNCQSTSTAGHWNRSVLEPDKKLCNACSSYERRNRDHRPPALNLNRRCSREPLPPSASPQCSNCHSTSTSGCWRRSVLEHERRLCDACSHYERTHDCHRPLALAQPPTQTRKKKIQP